MWLHHSGVHLGNGLVIDARFLHDPESAMSRLSQHYADIASHGGFNPNAIISPTYDERRHQGHDDDVSFTGSRGPLEFDGGAGAPFDGMSASGEEEADEDGELDEDDEEDEGGEGEEEENDAGVEAESGVGTVSKTEKNKVATGTRGPKWKDLEH